MPVAATDSPSALRYASFWRRLVASLIDFLIVGAATIAVGWIASLSRVAAVGVLPVLWTAVLAYEPLLHTLFGATVGKRVMQTRVVLLNGEKISWRNAVVRSSVALVFTASWMWLMTVAILGLGPQDFVGQGWAELVQRAKPALPPLFDVMDTAATIWAGSECLTTLFNRRRRAIHDYLAGTVVIRARRREENGGE
jgi:uncharacterized RDD family membrane protein YckC